MKGKIPEIAGSHVSSRVLQTCVKYCSQEERDAVFSELQPHLLTLSCNAYTVHLVKKMLDAAGGCYLISPRACSFASSAHGWICRLIDVISKLGLQKSSVIRHMSSVIQPILEKGIVDHSMIHMVLVEYLSIADQSSAADRVQQLSGPLLVRMIHTQDRSKIGMLCIRHGSAKERKKIIKGMKGHISKIMHNQCGCMVLVGIVSMVDDTKLITKFIIRELQATLKELSLDKSGRRFLLRLLHPNCSRYLNSNGLAFLNLSVPSLSAKNDSEVRSEKLSREKKTNMEAAKSDIPEENLEEPTKEIAKTDHDMTETELVKAIFPKRSFPQLRVGRRILPIAALAAKPKSEEPEASEEEHVLENFHSSRTIQKLILDCPAFASTLWKKSLEGKFQSWAQGHSSKVVCAFWESSDFEVRKMAKEELKPLVDGGILKIPENMQSANEGR
ncbi:hypothetical protein V6N11_018544 [Hibiscus sabdariffa]|uniref:Uncharacterized protein n=1 Tax=Hibiscus sabdariffa TaxID=183260 RepID=A0ABR2T7Q4_9ROSI